MFNMKRKQEKRAKEQQERAQDAAIRAEVEADAVGWKEKMDKRRNELKTIVEAKKKTLTAQGKGRRTAATTARHVETFLSLPLS